MARYLLISTVIVFTIAVVVAGWINRDLIRIKIASVYAHVPPKPGSANPVETANPVPLHGDAPWALSALPECFVQLSVTTGPRPYVLAHLPAGSVAVDAPASLTYADCSISLHGDRADVVRGEDRFRIPPHVELYRTPETLSLLRRDASGLELRVYQPKQP
jgi:hypothetical protein